MPPAVDDTGNPPPTRAPGRVRSDLIAFAAGLLLLTAAVVVGIVLNARGVRLHAGSAPILGGWKPHLGPGTPLSVALGLVGVAYGPSLADRLPWRRLLWTAWGTALAWVVAVGMVDSWKRLTNRLDKPGEYPASVPGMTGAEFFDGWVERIAAGQPDKWPTHVAGHPPGALAFFYWLDGLGLAGPQWAAIACMVIGSSAAVAVAIAVSRLGDSVSSGRSGETVARRALPFLVFTPAALWIGSSADAVFMAVSAWGLALVVVATTTAGPRRLAAALAGGGLLGGSLYLSYGLVLFGLLVLAVLLITTDWRAVLWAAIPVAALVIGVTAAGFAWWEGYFALVDRYYAGWGGTRPYSYWVWANLGAVVVCAGPAVAPALVRAARRVRRDHRWRWELLPVAAMLAIVGATLSGLSKAETERIWLPFIIWLISACALLPTAHRRAWLAVQMSMALLAQHLLTTRW